MSIALATKGVLGGFIAAGAGTGEPFPVPIQEFEVDTSKVKNPIVDVAPEIQETIPIDYEDLEPYLPNKQSTIKVLPSAGLRTFPKPGDL